MKHEAQFQFQATAAATAEHCRSIIVGDLRTIFANPQRWTQRVGARDVHGEPTYATSSRAWAFDIWGAMYHSVARHNIPYPIYGAVLDDIALEMRGITGRPPAPWNDDPDRTAAEVDELVRALRD